MHHIILPVMAMASCSNIFASAAGPLYFEPPSQSETIKITATSDNKFDPDTVKASKGDIIEFHFEKGNHSVASGLYDFPCAPSDLGTGFYSGFVSTEDDKADEVFRILINDTKPIVFYSSQDKDCPRGMVGIINPDDDHSIDDYRDRASKLAKGGSPPQAYGGKLVEDGGDDDDDDDKDSDGDKDDKDDKDDDNGKDGNKDGDKDNGSENNEKDKDSDNSAGAFQIHTIGLIAALAVALSLC